MRYGAAATGSGVASTLVTDLALSAPADVARLDAQRVTLVAAARSLVAAAGHDPDVVVCEAAGCRLPEVAVADVCEVVHGLALLDDGPPRPTAFAVAWEELRHALVGASEAIGACRRTAHPHGACWFRTGGGDGCATLLRLAHRLG